MLTQPQVNLELEQLNQSGEGVNAAIRSPRVARRKKQSRDYAQTEKEKRAVEGSQFYSRYKDNLNKEVRDSINFMKW